MPISDKQRAVLDDLWSAVEDDREVAEKHGLDLATLRQWLSQPDVAEEIEWRHEEMRRRARFLLARGVLSAVQKLFELLQGEKEEPARKAALDILAAGLAPTADSATEPAALNPSELAAFEGAGDEHEHH